MEFRLGIAKDSFTMDFERHVTFDTTKRTISCLPKENAIAQPQTWKITNGVGDLKDKHLLVFHLLPPSATRRYEGGANKGPLTTKPKCDLFIQFVSFEFFTKIQLIFYLSEKASLRISSSRPTNNDYKHNYNNTQTKTRFQTTTIWNIPTTIWENSYNSSDTKGARNYNKRARSTGHRRRK